jgi:hypothetical protein
MMDLNDLIDPASGVIIERAQAINNAGQILGYGWNTTGLQVALRHDPVSAVPEPAAAGMLLVGITLVGMAARRKS